MPRLEQDSMGAILYRELYPPDPERFPRGRKPWRAVDAEGQEHFQSAAEAIAFHLLDALAEEVRRHIPLIDYGQDTAWSFEEALKWLSWIREHIEETGEVPEWE